MPRRYTIEIHRTVPVPERSGGWGWMICAFVLGCGIAAVGDHLPLRAGFENPADFHNPSGTAPDDDEPVPDTAKPLPV